LIKGAPSIVIGHKPGCTTSIMIVRAASG
jgi:hypothetical protein